MTQNQTKNKTDSQEGDNKKLFKYYPEDFGDLSVKVIHMNLDFDMYEDHTVTKSDFKAKTLEEIDFLEMNAKNLEILEVSCDVVNATYEYKKDEAKLIVKFESSIPKNTEFIITTKTICRPTENILEGIYYDETPKGCPRTQITQCQQWGFQRIVPCIDDMTAKCTYTTTITADKRYTNMLTNGDVIQERIPVGEDREQIRYSNEVTPMATYLFFLGVGTYDTFTKQLEYPDGKTFQLELLALVGANKESAKRSLEILHDGILWIHLCTGPNKYENEETSKKIIKLIREREVLKESGADEVKLTALRKEIKDLAAPLTLGYQYTGTVYREIGMQNSDFGGMENVGNTTISGNRLMPYPEMVDHIFEYMIRVKVHEFYHNLNGSEVTGRSPFEIWLNEAVTVHIEKEYHDYLFGEDYGRLEEVLSLLNPNGVFMQDAGAASMPIEPDGFNDPNELITHITYIKAPELVRMIQTLMGYEKFVKGLDLYHRRYKHSNASRKQWLEAMEEVSGLELQDMANTWLKKTHYPIVKAQTSYDSDKKEFVVTLKQVNSETIWEFPFRAAILDKEGKVLSEKLERITKKEQKIVFSNVPKPAITSLNKGYSFYGKLLQEKSKKELFLQVRKDSDIINKYMAFYELMDKEKTRLLKNKKGYVQEKLVDLYFEMISDKELMRKTGGQILTIFEYVEDKNFAHKYQELYEVKEKILLAIAKKYKKELKELYKYYAAKTYAGTYLEQQVQKIKDRAVKNIALGILSRLEEQEIYAMIKKQYHSAECMTDKASAFSIYLNSMASDKLELFEDFKKNSVGNLVSWEIFLATVGRNDSEDAIEIIKKIAASPEFRIEQTNDQRALFMTFAYNKKKSLLTQKGRAYLEELVIKLTQVNEYSTNHLLEPFASLDKMDEETHEPLVKLLVNLLKSTTVEKTPSVYNTTKRMLKNLPKAVANYEKSNGKIIEL